MILNAGNVADCLLDHGWFPVEAMVDGDFLIEEIVSRRNRCFKVTSEQQIPVFLKQVLNWTPEMFAAMKREVACHQIFADQPDLEIASILPRWIGFDADRHILALELIRNAETLGILFQRKGRLNLELAGQLGFILGTVHARTEVGQGGGMEGRTEFLREPPGVLRAANQMLRKEGRESGRSRILDEVRSKPGFREGLKALSSGWKQECLIHGDIRWTNFLVHRDENDALNLKLIDWELADVGDPCWDVGGVLQSFLASWVFSLPGDPRLTHEQRLARAQCPLKELLPAISVFWDGYVESREMEEKARQRFLERSVRCAGARMIQTSFEAAPKDPVIPWSLRTLLQVSLNILTAPRAAIEDLLELGTSGGTR